MDLLNPTWVFKYTYSWIWIFCKHISNKAACKSCGCRFHSGREAYNHGSIHCKGCRTWCLMFIRRMRQLATDSFKVLNWLIFDFDFLLIETSSCLLQSVCWISLARLLCQYLILSSSNRRFWFLQDKIISETCILNYILLSETSFAVNRALNYRTVSAFTFWKWFINFRREKFFDGKMYNSVVHVFYFLFANFAHDGPNCLQNSFLAVLLHSWARTKTD